MNYFIKYLGVVGCAVIAYPRMLGLREKKSAPVGAAMLLFVFVAAYVVARMRVGYAFVRFPMMLALTVMALYLAFRLSFMITFTGVVYSYGISYAMSVIANLPIFVIRRAIQFSFQLTFSTLVAYMMITCLQFVLTIALFHMKVWKNGAPFLRREGEDKAGVMVGAIALALVFTLGVSQGVVRDFLTPIVCIAAAAGFTLLLWYRDKFRQENMKRNLNRTLRKQDERIGDLEEKGRAAELLLHRQNKYLTAISRKARQFARQKDLPPAEAGQRRAFSEEVDGLTQSCGAAISGYARRNGRCAATRIPALDASLAELNARAAGLGTDLHVAVSGNAPDLCAVVGEMDMTALTSGLVEYALGTAAADRRRYIAVHIWAEAAPYRVDVHDAGSACAAELLPEAIPLLCQKHGISLELETLSGNIAFSRRVSLCFDGLGETRRYRAESGAAYKAAMGEAASGRSV